MTIAQIHEIFLGCGSRISTDSRKIEKGELFWALKGENFDGNKFAVKALEDGAAYCVVDADSQAALCSDKRIIAVDDTLKALWDLAAYHRENTLNGCSRIKMLALTGTNGKTTTKELIKAVLKAVDTPKGKANVTATEGNLNNNIGVPLSVLRITPQTDFAVIEMGASHPGDINELVQIAHPDFGLITNVGKAHLLGFGSFEGVKKTKGELYDYIRNVRGRCFVNTSSEDLRSMVAQRTGLLTIPYGEQVQQSSILPTDAEHPFLRMEAVMGGNKVQINTRLVGSYNAPNVLAALAVGGYFGVKPEDAVRAIESYEPTNKRSQMLETERNTVIVDAYNANPSSMAAALDNFAVFRGERKSVMLGDMLELGEDSLAEHTRIVERLCTMGLEKVVLVGSEFAKAVRNVQAARNAEAVNSAEAAASFECFATSEDAARSIAAEKICGMSILLKGSRGTKMENILSEI